MTCRIATITTLANIVYTHFIDKVTHSGRIQINDFTGSVSLNIQPVLMNTLVQNDDWVAVVRSKVTRYYHLYRPTKPRRQPPTIELEWGPPLQKVRMPKYRGKLYYQLTYMGLTQWGYSRVQEHLYDYLRACAALDGRDKVNVTDYNILIKLFKPLQLERHIIETYGFESGRIWSNNIYCIFVELASFGEPTIDQISVDYKCSPRTTHRLVATVPDWCWTKTNSPTRIVATDRTREIFDVCGVNQKW